MTRPAKRSKTARQHDDGTTPTTTPTATASNNKKLRNLLLSLEAFDHNNNNNKDQLVLLEDDDNNAAKEIVDDICNGGIDQVENMRMKLQYIDGLLSDTLSTLKQKKKKKEEEQKKESQTDDYPPLEVVRRVIHSGYLTSVDLGRFLLFSNKSFLKNLTPEFVYKKLCTIHWGFHIDDDEHEMNRIITTTMGGSYQRALQSGLEKKPIVKSEQAPKPNWLGTWTVPKTILSSENIVLVASVWTNSSKIFSTRLSTKEVKSLLESSSDGGYTMTIPLPIYKNMKHNLEKDLVKQTKGKTAHTMNRENKKVPLPKSWPIMKIHCIRMDIHQIRIIYDSSLSLLHVDGTIPIHHLHSGCSVGRDLSLRYDTQFFSPSWPLTPTDLGQRLLGRWLNSKSSLVFKYSGLTFSSRTMSNGRFFISAGATGAQKYFICPYDNSNHFTECMERNNVTMYHLLQELQLWD